MGVGVWVCAGPLGVVVGVAAARAADLRDFLRLRFLDRRPGLRVAGNRARRRGGALIDALAALAERLLLGDEELRRLLADRRLALDERRVAARRGKVE